MNSQGVEQWGLTSAQMGQYFGLTAKQSNQLDASELTYDVGGSHLLFFYLASPTRLGSRRLSNRQASRTRDRSRIGLLGLGGLP